jgi:outer membrane protein assembly factor BamA
MPVAKLLPATAGVIGLPIKHRAITTMTEEIVRHYRKEGYSLARVESVSYDVASGVLSLQMNEGTIHEIDVEGGVRAKDSFVLREFPLQPGDVFQIDEANRGVTNISSTTLFEYVYLEVEYSRRDPVLTIRLKERPSQLVRFGMRADDERNLQGSIDIRDENFQGLGTELGLNINGGARNREAVLEFKAHRLFDTYLTFNLSAFYSLWDDYYYGDDPIAGPNRWDRQRLGEYRDERLGGRLTFGMQLEKFGNATIDYSLQEVHMKNKENAEGFRDRFRLSTVRIGTVIDSKDSYPFAREGFGANISYEFSLQNLGSEVGFNVVRFKYESYTTWGERHTLHPKFTFGFADKTMPLAEQFRLGGRESLFGTREADRRGRQLFLFNLEYRYFLPVRLIFESYIRLRFDMGSISDMPEQLKLATVRYGLGTELALDTPIGPAAIGIGKSFYFGRDLPANPFLQGPFLLYFAMGYQL